jgi:hypothetical protein
MTIIHQSDVIQMTLTHVKCQGYIYIRSKKPTGQKWAAPGLSQADEGLYLYYNMIIGWNCSLPALHTDGRIFCQTNKTG